MTDPGVPPEEQIGEPEGADPEHTDDTDNLPAQRREREDAEELVDEEDVDLPTVEP